MEAKFIVKTSMSRESMYAYQKAHRSKWLKILLIVCSIVSTVGAALLWVWNDEDKILFTLYAIFCVAATLFLDRFNAWIAYRGYNRAVGEITYGFSEEGYTTHCSLEDSALSYQSLVKLLEADDYYFLYVQKRLAYILPKADFTHGNPADFSAFIAEKTGLEVKRVKG